MGRQYNFNRPKEQLLDSRMNGWPRGLNTLVSNTQIKPNELSEAQDIQLVEDGKIQCPRDGQDYYGSSSGSHVTGIFSYFKSDGTHKLLRVEGTNLQVFNTSTLAFDNVSGATYTTTLNTNATMAYDRLYIENGTDSLSYYDGSTITTFVAISAPVITSTVRTGGSSGSYTYSYKVTAVTDVGETTPSAAATDTLDVATLTNTKYMTTTWSAATNAIGYNVYGRKNGSWFFIKFLEGNGTTSFVDDGTITPSETERPPEGNSTGGQKGQYIVNYKDSLIIAGDPANPSRLYYSGGGDKIHDFNIDSNGGLVDISKNDGQKITGLAVFKNTLLIFKEDSIYQMTFSATNGLPSVTQVNAALGCIAPRSIVAVENDVFFASRRGVFTIGNEQGFAFDVLRTNELTARVRSIYNTIDPAYIQNIAAIYATKSNANLVIFSYTSSGSTTNTEALVYDRERLGWYKWSNINANSWTTYRGSDGINHFLYGDDSSGYVKEILSGSDDFGSAIHGYFRIRAEDFKELDRYKKLKDVSLVLRKPSGYIRLNIIKDGVDSIYATNVGTVSPSVNWGHYVFNRFQFKTGTGTATSSQDENVLRTTKNLNLEGRSFLLELDNNSVSSFTFLQAHITAKPRAPRYRKSTDLF